MKYVLDASVALAWVIPRPMSPKALSLRDDFSNQIHELIAPSTFGAEVASGLTKAERQKLIAVGEAAQFLVEILRTSPHIHAYDAFLARATDISSAVQSGLHDCLYIALAEGRSASSSPWMTNFSRTSRKTSRSSFTWERYDAAAWVKQASQLPGERM